MHKSASQILTVIKKQRYEQSQKYGQTVLQFPEVRKVLHDNSYEVFQEQYVVCSSQIVNLTLLMTLADLKFFEEHSAYLREINKNDRGVINALIRDPNNFGIAGKSSEVVEKFNKYTECVYTNLQLLKRLRVLADKHGRDYLANEKKYNLKTCFVLEKTIPKHQEHEKFQIFVSSIEINDSLSLIMALHFKNQVSLGEISKKVQQIRKIVSNNKQEINLHEIQQNKEQICQTVSNRKQEESSKNNQAEKQMSQGQLPFPLPEEQMPFPPQQQKSLKQKLLENFKRQYPKIVIIILLLFFVFCDSPSPQDKLRKIIQTFINPDL